MTNSNRISHSNNFYWGIQISNTPVNWLNGYITYNQFANRTNAQSYYIGNPCVIIERLHGLRTIYNSFNNDYLASQAYQRFVYTKKKLFKCGILLKFYFFKNRRKLIHSISFLYIIFEFLAKLFTSINNTLFSSSFNAQTIKLCLDYSSLVSFTLYLYI